MAQDIIFFFHQRRLDNDQSRFYYSTTRKIEGAMRAFYTFTAVNKTRCARFPVL